VRRLLEDVEKGLAGQPGVVDDEVGALLPQGFQDRVALRRARRPVHIEPRAEALDDRDGVVAERLELDLHGLQEAGVRVLAGGGALVRAHRGHASPGSWKPVLGEVYASRPLLRSLGHAVVLLLGTSLHSLRHAFGFLRSAGTGCAYSFSVHHGTT